MLTVLSLGAGVQSSTLALMAAHGEVTPMPDCAIFSDTQAEPSAVYRWLDYLETRLPFPVHRVTAGNLREAILSAMRSEAKDGRMDARPPFFTASGGILNRQCTQDYKIYPIQRKVRELIGLKPRQRGPKTPVVEQWIGISLDEVGRMKPSRLAYVVHRWPLIERRMSRHDCTKWLERHGYPRPPKSACTFCLSGETEVVTRDGIRFIRELAGGSHDLLVPTMGKRGGLAVTGKFVRVPVREFGQQRLHRLILRRGRQTREIFATAEHRWILAPTSQWTDIVSLCRITTELRLGDRLRPLRATPLAKETPAPFGICQGFVFGDGAKGKGQRPASLPIYDKAKDSALLPYFSHGTYGLPRFWKMLPPIRESRAFLLGWLAGYFAADGSVSSNGQAVLESAQASNLEFVRSVCAVLGVSCSTVRSRNRRGLGGIISPLYRVTIRAGHLPPSFWLIPHHAARASKVERRPNMHWTVMSVDPTDRVDTVYCATVLGAAAFGLSEDLMTGNCPYHDNAQWRVLRDDPEAWAEAVEIDEAIRPGVPGPKRPNGDSWYVHRSRKPLAEVDLSTAEERGQLSMFQDECEGMCGV